MSSVRHVGAMDVTEQDAPAHRAVKWGRGVEVTALGGGGETGGHLQRIQRLWAPPGDGDLLPITGEDDLGGGRRLVGGGQELVTGEGGVEENEKNSQQGGGGAAGVQIFI